MRADSSGSHDTAVGNLSAISLRKGGTSHATLSAYERGLKSRSLTVAERIVEAARLPARPCHTGSLHLIERVAPGVMPFWVPDRLWRGRLPEYFATISVSDPSRPRGITRFDLRRRASRRRIYEKLLRRGLPDELIDWIDGALLIDLWDDIRLPHEIRSAWQPAVDLAGHGPLVHPTHRGFLDVATTSTGQNRIPRSREDAGGR